MSERQKLLILYICGIGLYFFTNLQRSGVPGSLFNELQGGLALTAAQVTMLGTCFIYVYTFNQLIAGVMNDRYGGIRMMLFGTFFFSLGSILFPLTGSVWAVICCWVTAKKPAAAEIGRLFWPMLWSR